MRRFAGETWAQLERWLLHLRRQPFHLAITLLQPVIFLVLFGGLFSRIVDDSLKGAGYLSFILPGILALTVFNNSMFSGVALIFDREMGFLERLLTTPISRASILVARFAFTNLLSVLQVLGMLGAGVLIGASVETGPVGIGVMLAYGILLGFGTSLISMVLAFKLRGHADFFALLSVVSLPLVLASNAFAPLASMPGWLRWLALLNPLTHAASGMRAALLGDAGFGWLHFPLLALVAFDALCLALGVRVYRQRLS